MSHRFEIQAELLNPAVPYSINILNHMSVYSIYRFETIKYLKKYRDINLENSVMCLRHKVQQISVLKLCGSPCSINISLQINPIV